MIALSPGVDLKSDFKRTCLLNGCRAVALLHCITCERSKLPLCVSSRLLEEQDVPGLVCKLINASPWKVKTDDGACWDFQEGNWIKQKPNPPPLSTLECQMWALLLLLLLGKCDVG